MGLTQVPNDFDESTVTNLYLDSNNIPNPVFTSLPALTRLDMKSCGVTTFPDINQMPLLITLNLQHNGISSIPEITTTHASGEQSVIILYYL